MKKIVALVLCMALFLAVLPAAGAVRDFTVENQMAEELKALGLFQGVSSTNFDLDRAPTRVEALVMLIRLLGREKEAQAGACSHPFADVPGWANDYVGYAYENGLTNGTSETTFGTGSATAAMYLTFVLRALGYSDENETDFSWRDPYSLATTTGILDSYVSRTSFLRADVVRVSFAALPAFLKGTSVTLAEKLEEQGVFTREQYESLLHPALLATPAAERAMTAEEIYSACSPAVFYVAIYDRAGDLLGSGSGFFISSDGTAVTNFHVITSAYSAKATLTDGHIYDVEGVFDGDEKNDWAVIKVKGSGFPCLPLAEASAIAGGATVYALGSPLGLQNSISAGIISNPARTEEGVTFIQTTAAISHGSSGGALLSATGQVLGITAGSYEEGQNLNLAIPITAISGYNRGSLSELVDVGETAGTVVRGTGMARQASSCSVLSRWIEDNCNDWVSGYPAVSYYPDMRGLLSLICTEAGVDVRMTRVLDNRAQVTSFLTLTPDSRSFVFQLYYSAGNRRYSQWDLHLSGKLPAETFSAESKGIVTGVEGNSDGVDTDKLAAAVLELSLQETRELLKAYNPECALSDFGFTNYG